MSNPNSSPVAAAPGPLLDLAYIAELAKKSVTMEEVSCMRVGRAYGVLGKDIVDLSMTVTPAEKLGQRHTQAASFVEAVNRWKLPESVLFIHPERDEVTAVLDYVPGNKVAQPPVTSEIEEDFPLYPKDEREPSTRVLKLTLGASDEWKAWSGISGKLLTQAEFAEFLHEWMDFIQEPAPNAILKIARELEGRTEVKWAGKVNPQTGARTLSWSESVSGNQGDLGVPESLKLKLRLWQGSLAREVGAGFGFRAPSSGLGFIVKLRREADIRETSRADLAAALKEATGLPVFIGEVTL